MAIKTKFKDMVVGQQFILDVGDPEYDQLLYKLDGTTAVMETRNGRRETMKPEGEHATTAVVRDVQVVPTDLERTAITLLYQHRGQIYHPALREWVEAIGQDADEVRHFDWFEFSDGARERMEYLGFPLPTGNEGIGDYPMMQAVTEWSEAYPSRHELNGDGAVYYLASAVVEYREIGRVSGGMDYRFGTASTLKWGVRTGLAAAVGEFHQRIVQAMYYRMVKATDELEEQIQVLKRGGAR